LTCKQLLDVPGEVVDDGICTLNIQPTSGIVLFLFRWGVIDFICFNNELMQHITIHHPVWARWQLGGKGALSALSNCCWL